MLKCWTRRDIVLKDSKYLEVDDDTLKDWDKSPSLFMHTSIYWASSSDWEKNDEGSSKYSFV